MRLKYVAKIKGGQDGAIWNNYLFRFDSKGNCFVYNLEDIDRAKGGECAYVSTFVLDKADKIVPHSNSVTFGNEYYSSEDEYPLLYTNIYNNYAKTDNPLKGVCLVYRIQRNGTKFVSALVQMIEIGFTEDAEYWKSGDDVRPYGNFALDRERGIYYAFTMRDNANSTRYFSFDLPKAEQGEIDDIYNVKKVVLTSCHIKEYFDCEYHRFLQGAIFHEGQIYSLEGFTDDEKNPSAMRIIDVNEKKQTEFVDFRGMGCNIEPELIDFHNDVCYYGDNEGNLYKIEF